MSNVQAETSSERDSRALEARLDDALEDTFPASDPFSVNRFTSTEPRPSRGKPAGKAARGRKAAA